MKRRKLIFELEITPGDLIGLVGDKDGRVLLVHRGSGAELDLTEIGEDIIRTVQRHFDFDEIRLDVELERADRQ